MDCDVSTATLTFGDVAALSAYYGGDVFTRFRETSISAFGGGTNNDFSSSYRSKGMVSGTTAMEVVQSMGQWANAATSMLAEVVACDPDWYKRKVSPCEQPKFISSLQAITGLYGQGQSNVEAIARARDNDRVLFPVKLYAMARTKRTQLCYDHDLPPAPINPKADYKDPAEGTAVILFSCNQLTIITNKAPSVDIPTALVGTTFRHAKVQSKKLVGTGLLSDTSLKVVNGDCEIEICDATDISGVIASKLTLDANFSGNWILEGKFTHKDACDYYSGVYQQTHPRYSHYSAMLEHVPSGCVSAVSYAKRGYAKLISSFIMKGHVTAENARNLLAIDDDKLFCQNVFTALKETVWAAGHAGEARAEFARWYQCTIALIYVVYMFDNQIR